MSEGWAPRAPWPAVELPLGGDEAGRWKGSPNVRCSWDPKTTAEPLATVMTTSAATLILATARSIGWIQLALGI
jgi:hypothetical protein